MDAPTGILFDVMRFSTRDGPGIRTTLFFKGCSLSCWWCHNPESQRSAPELIYRPNLCVGCLDCVEACPHEAISPWEGKVATDLARCQASGDCVPVCPADARQIAGRVMSVAQVMAEVLKDRDFYEQSGGGVTFSGGEPLQQPEFLAALLQACRQEGLHTAVDTSGWAPWSVLEGLHGLVDLYLYDLKLLDDERHLQYTGVSNQRILENLRRLAALGEKIRLRLPLIPGVNDRPEDLQALGEFLATLPGQPEVEVLPYHTSWVEKYRRLGRPYPLEGLIAPAEAQVESWWKEMNQHHQDTNAQRL
jgi:pyruvate formate lyase activating enzyme